MAEPSTAAVAATQEKPAVERKPAVPTLSLTGFNRNVVVLDPSHGGADSGARIGDTTLEKNVTLALAFRLRSLLVARGFTVVLTRDSDAASEANSPGTPLTLDDRAGIANHMRASACLLLHATGRGLGVHLYSSELDAVPAEPYLPSWLNAQGPWVPASQGLEQGMSTALGRSHIALVSSSASVRPVDSLTCPALVVELAPETDTPASVNDAGYQERVAAAIAGALVVWENAAQPPVRLPRPVIPHKSPPASTETAPETQP